MQRLEERLSAANRAIFVGRVCPCFDLSTDAFDEHYTSTKQGRNMLYDLQEIPRESQGQREQKSQTVSIGLHAAVASRLRCDQGGGAESEGWSG